jgi:hypothetical protein
MLELCAADMNDVSLTMSVDKQFFAISMRQARQCLELSIKCCYAFRKCALSYNCI